MAKPYSQLIQTKLSVPKLRSRVISRGRLIDQAGAEPTTLLTLVSAPAGYGKTTLMLDLSRALADSGTAICWYALDSNDNDPNLFGCYLVAALGDTLRIETTLAPVARLLRSSTEPNLEKSLVNVINSVALNQQKCALVLDDYHLITSPAVHSAIAFLLEHLPENVHLIIGSRSDPPLPLGRLRARGQLTEIRAADLRFTRGEAEQFLNETMRLGLSSQTVAEIESRTEGWVTGLQLAALSMAGREDGAAFISRFGGNNRYLVDYLLHEVVERQPAEVQRFLLSTSVLERLCGPLCDAVLGGQSGSDAILRRLEQENLFMVPLDDEGHWYRYHHLFGDFLRTRLSQSEPELVPLLHRAASQWYESQGLLSEAVSHAVETHDWDYAAELVEKHGMTIFNRSEVSALYKWCEMFPEETFRTHPMLCILQAWPLGLSYRKENRTRVEERLQQAERVAGALEDKARGHWLIGQAALARLSLCLAPDPTTDPEEVIALCGRTLELLSADDPRRSLPYAANGYAYMAMQNVPMARKGMEDYLRLSLAGRFYYGAVAPTFYLSNLAFCQGQLGRAKDMCLEFQRSMSSVFANPEQDLPALGSLDISRGCVLLEENRLEEAEPALLHGLDLATSTNNPFYRMMASAALFRVREIQGRIAEALQFLDDIEGAWPDITFYTQGLRLMHLMRISPEDPQTLVEAETWCEGFRPYVAESMPLPGIGPFGGAQAYYMASLIWVQAEVLLGKPQGTLSYLSRQKSVAEAQGLTYRLIELSLAEAQARSALGEEQQAYELLERALKLAKAAGCLRVFDQGAALGALLAEAGRSGMERDYVAQVMRSIGTPATRDTEGIAARTGAAGKEGGYETLSERELEVLHLMATGASNQHMADQLVVTVGTVKSHVNHILGKLCVHNRLEAVARARELGLLQI